MPSPLNDFGAWIKQRRRALDLTQHDLARQVGCAVITLQKLEAGARRPSQQLLGRLADSLQLTADERVTLFQLGRAQHRASDAAPPPAPDVPPLRRERRPLTPLIGRGADVVALMAQLAVVDARLVTCLGPGGVGKTRLSLAVADQLATTLRDGVYFVALAPVREPALLPAVIAHTLGVTLTSAAPWDDLFAYLRDREQLLILDNFEHLVAAAPAIVDLLEACPALTILVTSRERLRVRGEHVFSLAPLALPDLAQLPMGKVLADVPAIALFCAVAQAVQPNFLLTPTNQTAVAELCTRLDGLPLAIEIVGGRAGVFSPALLLQQLDHHLTLETDGPRDLPDRQRTLRAAFDWSYAQLAPDEQHLFDRLGVFAPGWDVEAAATISSEGTRAPTALLAPLEALSDKTLLYRLDGDEPRFALLEPLREYAWSHLVGNGTAEHVQQRHAEHYLALAETAAPELRSAQMHVWVERLKHDHDNIQVALAWLIAQNQIEGAARICVALRRFWWAQGYLGEGLAWLARIFEHIDRLPPKLQTNLQYAAGLLTSAQGNAAPAARHLRQALAQARTLGDLWMVSCCTNALGLALVELQQYDEAQPLLEESLQIDQARGDPNDIAVSLAGLANLHYHQGHYAQTRQLIEQGLAVHRVSGDLHSTALMLSNLSEVTRRLGDTVTAQATIEEALQLMRQLDARRMLPYALNNLGNLLSQQGQLDEARAALAEALALLLQTGDRSEQMTSLLGCTLLLLHMGNYALAVRFLSAIDAAVQTATVAPNQAARADWQALLARAQAQLAPAQFAAAWDTGHAWTFDQAVVAALHVARAGDAT